MPGNPFALRNPFREDDEEGPQSTGEGATQSWAADREVFLESQTAQFYNRETNEISSGGMVYDSNLSKPCGPPLGDLSLSNRFDVQIIALADASNVYTATISQQPRTVDKLTKITLSTIRDLSATFHFSFLDSHSNVADYGTKIQCNLQILSKLCRQSVFAISFAGRRESRRLKNLLKMAI